MVFIFHMLVHVHEQTSQNENENENEKDPEARSLYEVDKEIVHTMREIWTEVVAQEIRKRDGNDKDGR